MDEYIRETLKVDLFVRRILESPIYHRFFAAAPGLPELMLLGKIMILEESRSRRRPRYDLILVDAPATGHGLAFLKVPLAASKAIPMGPVGNRARRILKLIRDPKKTALAIVAIPEEMAVVEAAQLHDLATKEVGISPEVVFLNRCQERRFTKEQEAEVLRLAAAGAGGRLARGVSLPDALASARRQIRRRKLTRFYQTRLRRALPLPVVPLPHLLIEEELGPASLRLLAERIEAA
jgi:anion-transporting  ArsA/GET3 family ATPase